MAPVPNRVKTQKKQNNQTAKDDYKIEQFVTFWGVRGTIPIPNENMLKYGGNTSCVEVLAINSNKNSSIILDAGTGIIQCAENALLRGDRIFHLFFNAHAL